MESQNPQPHHAEPIPFDPAEYGLDPTSRRIDEEILQRSHGDLFLLAHEMSLVDLENEHRIAIQSSRHVSTEELQSYYNKTAQLRGIISKRRVELGIDEPEIDEQER